MFGRRQLFSKKASSTPSLRSLNFSSHHDSDCTTCSSSVNSVSDTSAHTVISHCPKSSMRQRLYSAPSAIDSCPYDYSWDTYGVVELSEMEPNQRMDFLLKKKAYFDEDLLGDFIDEINLLLLDSSLNDERVAQGQKMMAVLNEVLFCVQDASDMNSESSFCSIRSCLMAENYIGESDESKECKKNQLLNARLSMKKMPSHFREATRYFAEQKIVAASWSKLSIDHQEAVVKCLQDAGCTGWAEIGKSIGLIGANKNTIKNIAKRLRTKELEKKTVKVMERCKTDSSWVMQHIQLCRECRATGRIVWSCPADKEWLQQHVQLCKKCDTFTALRWLVQQSRSEESVVEPAAVKIEEVEQKTEETGFGQDMGRRKIEDSESDGESDGSFLSYFS